MKQEWTTDHRDWYRNVYLKSQHWIELKILKLKANPVCERCGSNERLEPHHVNYRNLFDVTIPDLETLCRSCHTLEHEENGMPRRDKISYWNYFPSQVLDRIREQFARRFDLRPAPRTVWTKEEKKINLKRMRAENKMRNKFKLCNEASWKATRI